MYDGFAAFRGGGNTPFNQVKTYVQVKKMGSTLDPRRSDSGKLVLVKLDPRFVFRKQGQPQFAEISSV